MARYHLICTLFIICLFQSVSVASNIDSLKNLLKNATEDTAKVRLLNEISWAYNRTDLSLTEDYAKKALELSKINNDRKGEARALNLLGIVASGHAKIDFSIQYNLEALQIAEEIGNEYLIGVTTNDLGNDYSQRGNFDLALKYYQRSLDIAKKENDILGIAFTTGNIGILHQQMGNSEKALDYLELAAEVGQQSTDPMVLAGAYSNLSGVYYEKEDYDKALEYEEKALEIAQKSGDRLSVAYSLMYIGDMQNDRGFTEIAEESFIKALREARKLDDKYVIATVYLQTANLYQSQKKYNDAIIVASIALEMAQGYELGDLEADINYTLAQAHSSLGAFEKAFNYSEAYNELADSFYRVENQRIVAELETLYKTNETLAENELLLAENEKNKKLIKQRTTIMAISLISLILLVLLVLALYSIYSVRKTSLDSLASKVKERTEELENSNHSLIQTNAALERFNYIASHDLREPLRNIKSFSDLLKRATQKGDTKSALEYVNFIQSGSKRMFALVEAIQDVTNFRKTTPQFEYIDITKVLEDVIEDLLFVIEESQAVVNYSELPFIKGDKALLSIVLQNLVNNAIKYNENTPPMIDVSYTETIKDYVFAVKDNGIGIEEEYYEKVFDAFKRLHHYEEVGGTGIGMFITKDIVEMHSGRIWIEPNHPEGSIFKFTIPK